MKTLIIKLGAKGDVLRTLSILPALKKKYPESSITWITKQDAKEVFLNNPYVDRVLSISESLSLEEEFDILYCLEIEKEASDIAARIKAKDKKGFYLEGGYPASFNPGGEYYLNTFFDDNFKKNNKKTVQEMMFMACDMEYNHEFCPIYLDEKEKEYGESYIKNKGLDGKKLVGIHIGASALKWPSRFWTEETILDFIEKASKNGLEILLFGSLRKEKKLKRLLDDCKSKNIKVYANDVRNTDREFLSLVNACSVMITSDSFAMHASLALKKPTITLFFCTSPDEIEGYGLLTKLKSSTLYDFFPERMDEYNEDLMKSISPEEVMEALRIQ